MRTITAISFILILALAAGTASAYEKEIAVASDGWVEFDLETGGTISILGWGGSSVRVEAEISGDGANNLDFRVEERDGKVVITSQVIEKRRHQRISLDLEVHVPSIFNIEIESMGGGVSIDGVEGTIRGRTMGGELQLTNLKGKLDLTTMGGQIVLTNSDVDGKVTTMGGKALVEDVFGDVKVTSMGGEVIRRRVTRTDGSSVGEEVHIDTMGGSIDVSDAPLGANVHTMGGDITIESAAVSVEAETMGGDIEIGEADGWVKATTMAGDVHVRVVGSHDVKLETMHGEVRLELPDAGDMNFDVEIQFTKNSNRNYRIESDFPLDISEAEDWAYDRGTPRKVIRGVSSGGGNRVVIRAINGNVYLSR